MKNHHIGLFLIIVLLSSTSPYISKSSNGGNVAHAQLLPIKVEHDKNGEVWRLPNGQYVFKAGDTAPSRSVENGINLNGTIVESSLVNVDLLSVVESEIVYKKNESVLSKESWYIYENGVKMNWSSIVDGNIFLTNEPVIEKVAGYVVTDYEREVNKNKTLSNNVGVLEIEYKIREGKPLKHTLDFMPIKNTKISICQEFSNVDYDEIIKYDDDSKNIIRIDSVVTKSESIDVKSVENKQKSQVQQSELQKSLPEIVEFRKNGELVLGEITTGAKSDFQSFEFDSDTNTAKFCYGEYDVKVDEKIIIDPDTYSSNDPTIDGYLADNDDDNNCENSPSSVGGSSSASVANIGREDSDLAIDCYRGYMGFNTSTIPDGADVTDSDITVDISTVRDATITCDITSLGNDPSTASAAQIFSDIGTGTVLVSASTSCQTVGNNKAFDLGTNGDSYIESKLASDFAGFGFKQTSDVGAIDANSHYFDIDMEENGSAVPKPTLEVVYSAETDVTVTINHYRGNTTALTTCNITQSNSSTSRTIACNSSGIAVFTGLQGNQNYTVTETNTNFVVNKTRNHTVSTNLIINATIVEVNCSQTGSATDIRLWYNQSNVHTMTNMTRPTCNSSNVIHWNGTFSPDGKNSMTGVTDVRIEIRNATAFGKNGIVLYTNGVSQTLSFSGSVITASDITVGSGTGSSQLLKNYLLLDGRPDMPSGTSATGVSTGQIDLSWSAPNSGVTPITGYRIYVSSDGGLNYSVLESDTGDTSVSYAHSGMTASSTRYYIVAAINSFGTGANSTAFSGSTLAASSSSPSSGGGGGGGGIIQTVSGFTLNLIPKTSSIFIGETKSFDIDFTWDIVKSKNLIIKSITIPSGSFDSLSIIPEQLTGFGKTVIDGKSSIRVTVQTPSDVCSPEKPTAKCVNLKQYTIPLQIFVQDQNGNNYGPFTAILELDVIKAVETGTTIILAVLVVVIIAISAFIVRSGSEKPSYPRNSKEHKKQYDNVIKNAKKVTKKGFFSKLLK